MLQKLATAARLLLGFDLLLNGVNWWWKLLPYPSLGEAPSHGTPQFVQAMIDTHFLFDGIKVVEVVTGLALLANRWVPAALVVAFPVTVAAWAVDFGLLTNSLRAEVLGWAILALNGFLLVAYIDRYLPMLTSRASPGQYWNPSNRETDH